MSRIESMQFGTYERQTLLVATSNLTGNVWNGELLVFDDWTGAPNRSKAISKFTTPAGCADACWLGPRLVVSASDTGAVEIWDWKGVGTFASVSEFHEHEDMVRAVDVNMERSQCLSASQDGSVKIWDASAAQGSSIVTLNGHTSAVFQARFGKTTETQQLIASVARDCTLRIWDTRQAPSAGQSVVRLQNYGTSVAWVPTANGSKIVAGHIDGSVRVFDPRNLEDSIATLTNQTGAINAIKARPPQIPASTGDTMSPENMFAVGSDDGSVMVYTIDSAGSDNASDATGISVVYKAPAAHPTGYVRGLGWVLGNEIRCILLQSSLCVLAGDTCEMQWLLVQCPYYSSTMVCG
eukprot:m.8031 g.8031  ORF g.8031 m.8031 type:complete len:352 (-) comp6032_c0_seq1:606-1661(-)